jgi:hypothetical protein
MGPVERVRQHCDDPQRSRALPRATAEAGRHKHLSVLHIRIKNSFLLKIVRHGVLRQKRRLETDLSSDPFAFEVWCVGRMIAGPTAAELPSEAGRLDLIELVQFSPGSIADSARDVDFEFENRHKGSKCPDCRFLIVDLNPMMTEYDFQSTLNNHKSSIFLAMREPLVKHEIHDHASDRDIHPQRPSPFGDGAMLVVAGVQSAV